MKTPKYFQKEPGFTICHYAGEVTYRGEELTTKNKDNIPQELIGMLRSSENSFISELFDDFQAEDTMGRRRKTVLSKFKVQEMFSFFGQIKCRLSELVSTKCLSG